MFVKGATVSVCDSSFVDLKPNCIKADGQHFILVVNVSLQGRMCWSSETKHYSPDLQEGELRALITCAEPGHSGLIKSKS